jgi:ribulose-5-phosphate 4-epimerase/fuculose-1-phosphate aldolase
MPALVPPPPTGTYDDPAEERLYRKQRLAAALRLFSLFGFEEGVAGHITARDPEDTETFWVNPFAMHFGHITVSDLIQVDSSGTVIYGDQPVNRAAFAIHSQVHAARLLEPITQDVCAFYEDHALFDDYTGVVYDTEEGKRIAHALGENKAVILRNHGLLTVGGSIEEAAWWFITMERSCQAQLLASAAGRTVHIDPEQAALTHAQIGHPLAGKFNFKPLFDRIVRAQPDLLD